LSAGSGGSNFPEPAYAFDRASSSCDDARLFFADFEDLVGAEAGVVRPRSGVARAVMTGDRRGPEPPACTNPAPIVL
jgi:hypothetical protein